MKRKPEIAVGYCRCSGVDNDRTSLKNQYQRIFEYCEGRGWKWGGYFIDNGRSARTGKHRPQLDKLLADAKKGKFNHVVVYRLDRFGRSTIDTHRNLEVLKKYGIKFHSTKEQIDTTSSEGQFFFTLLAALAQMESDRISSRMTDTFAWMKANGKKTGGYVPYGYREDANGLLIEDKRERKVIERMKQQRADGWTLDKIADDLNRRKVKTRNGKSWYGMTVSNILKREMK